MEDIQILEELIESYKDCYVEDYDMNVDVGMRLRDLQAIENLIARNKELEAENKALKLNLGIVTDDDMKHIPCID